MSSITNEPPPPPVELPKPGYPLLAWLVIVTAVTVAFVFQFLSARLAAGGRQYLSEVQSQGRLLIGMSEVSPETHTAALHQVEKAVGEGPYGQRIRYIVLLGELSGPKEALAELHKLRDFWKEHAPPEEDRQLIELLQFLYREYEKGDWDAPSLSEEDKQDLRQQLGWFGDLALAPAKGPNQAARTALLAGALNTYWMLTAAVVFGLAAAGLGFCLLGIGGLFVAANLLPLRFKSGSRDGGIYAETFALWMVLFMLLQYSAKFMPTGTFRMFVSGLLALASLIVVGWPVLRGVSWRRVRQDLGWWTRGSFVLEIVWGLGCYLASFPLVILGLFATMGLMKLSQRLAGDDPFAVPFQPTHPAGESLLHTNWLGYVQFFFAVSISAPILEETMFRGVLYRHLREIGPRWSRWASVLFSALVTSFVFAVIHPQGILGVPVLMALAFGFTMTRELRGSLLGSMVAHGTNNGLVMLIGIWLS